jgi:hypothetical protein
MGRRRDEDLRPGLRSFTVGEYVIIYRVEDEDVLILHVSVAVGTLKHCSGTDVFVWNKGRLAHTIFSLECNYYH